MRRAWPTGGCGAKNKPFFCLFCMCIFMSAVIYLNIYFVITWIDRSFLFLCFSVNSLSISVSVRSEVWVCCRWVAGIVSSNSAGSMECSFVCVCVLCIVRWIFLRRTDRTSRGVLPSVMCLNVIVKPRQGGDLVQLGLSSHKQKENP